VLFMAKLKKKSERVSEEFPRLTSTSKKFKKRFM